MPLKISDASRDLPRLNKWGDFLESRLERIEALQREHAKSVKNLKASTAAVVTLPNSPTSVSVSESGYIIDGVLYSEVTATYTAPNPQGTFAGVYLVVKGYRGSTELVKVAEHTFSGVGGGSASFKVTLQRTGETVTFYFVPKNANEASPTPWSNAPSTTATLDGNASAPNAPTGVTATSTASGNSLIWNENAELNMMSYRVYRNTTNSFVGATKIANIAFTGAGAPSYLDTTATAGTTYFYFITAVNTALQESASSSASVVLGNASVQGVAAGVSSILNPQGSLVNGQILQFTVAQNSNSSGSCTIQLTWPTTNLLRADGTTVAVAASSATWTGKAAGTTYFFYPCVRISDGTIHFATGAGPTGADPNATPNAGGSALAAAQANRDGFAPVTASVLNVTTPATSGGSGSSGGNNTCVEEHEVVMLRDVGAVEIRQVRAGDYVLGRDLKTGASVFRRVVRTEREYSSHWRKVNGHYVSPLERCWIDGRWQHAIDIANSQEEFFPSFRVKLTLEELPDDERNYIVGGNLVVHNVQPPC